MPSAKVDSKAAAKAAAKTLRRHSPGEHVEEELRYYRPTGFEPPIKLADLKMVLSRDNPHLDRYYDGIHQGRLVLRHEGTSLRIRVKGSGKMLGTFKRKQASEGPRSRRAETEDAVYCPTCQGETVTACKVCYANDNYVRLVACGESKALHKAREVADGVPLMFTFSIRNDRIDYHYRNGDAHVVLSEDRITYPDASEEQRIEVEHVAGDPALLDRIDGELRSLYPKLKVCKRGKLSEGRRRMARLLDASA